MDDPRSVEQDRIQRAAFNITSGFEGSKGYANYQNIDAGVISYGRFQFTLAAGSMGRVVDNYLAASSSDAANQLRNSYQARIRARDVTLRTDESLKALLISAASEDEMKRAQDKVVYDSYWMPSQDSVTARGIITPLGQALLFDMAVQHGPAHKLTQTAEQQLGAPPKSKLGENGLTEQQLITRVAQVRKDFLYDFAARNNLPGVKKRADIWVDLVSKGDWQLQGDASGTVLVFGATIQVKNPPGPSLALAPGGGSAPPVSPLAPAPAQPSQPASPSLVGSSEPGQAASGTFTTNRALPVRSKPDVNAELLGRVMSGKSLAVQRQFTPSASEEWLLTEVGWVARRLPTSPGEVFGELA